MENRSGLIRLHALPAPDVWHAIGTLPFYSVGPRSTLTVRVRAAGLAPGNVAGLVLSCRPCAWFGVECGDEGLALAQVDEQSGAISRVRLPRRLVWLRAECDFAKHECGFRYSIDGRRYACLGDSGPVRLPVGADDVPVSLFSCATASGSGRGYADFEDVVLTAERCHSNGAR